MRAALIGASVLAHVLLFTGLEVAPRMRLPVLGELKPDCCVDWYPLLPVYAPVHCSLRALMEESRITGVRIENFGADWIQYCPAPRFAETDAHVTGVVKLRVRVGTDGVTRGVRVVSGHPMLIAMALDAVRRWRYRGFVIFDGPEGVTDDEVTVWITFGDVDRTTGRLDNSRPLT